MLIEIPRRGAGQSFEKGTWQRLLTHTPEPEYRPYWTAMICCPECGRKLYLALHKIAADGQVSPSVGHPAEYPPCPWHVTPRLIGWEQWPTPPIPNPATCELCGKVSHTIGGWGTWSGGTGIICADCFKGRAVMPPSK